MMKIALPDLVRDTRGKFLSERQPQNSVTQGNNCECRQLCVTFYVRKGDHITIFAWPPKPQWRR